MNQGVFKENESIDDALEECIQAVYEAAIASKCKEHQRFCLQRMAELIGQRSPERIAQMERKLFGRTF